MLREEDIKLVRSVIDAFRSHELEITRDSERIGDAIEIVRQHTDNPRLCSTAIPTVLEPGDAVCFRYDHSDVNEPWRFGVVDKFNSGCLIIFTFNIKKRRESKSGRIVEDGPSYRQYDQRKMKRVRWVCRPATEDTAPAVAEDLVRLRQGVRELFEKFFEH